MLYTKDDVNRWIDIFYFNRESIDNWEFGNDVLYNLCKENPKHVDYKVVMAKLWLIGRSYAASIERGRSNADIVDSDTFYIDVAQKDVWKKIDFLISSYKEKKDKK